MEMHGFHERDRRSLALLGVEGRLLVHERSGTEVLVLANDEPNLSFALGVPTVPDADDGVAHILEHMVLAGSERFPLKDPFFSMIKGSVAGFLNAMTAPDRTMYPFATRNRRDFTNLLDVYLDAVFRPLLTRRTFDQEAWHLRPGDEAGTLALSGIVYNEMKGTVASPDWALETAEARALFPDTPARFEYGGDPAAIPDLTHERLRAFHAERYHPARARIVLHGPVPLEEALARIAAYVGEAESLPPVDPVPLQPPFPAPRRAEGVYPGSDGDGAFATTSWAFPEPAAPVDRWELELLEHVLVGRPSSPLRRALSDSGLGEAFVGGLDVGARQPVLRAGLRGVASDRVGQVHDLIRTTLADLADRGVDANDLEAGRNRIEFALREMDVHGGQRGLALALTALGPWLRGADPLTELDLDAVLADLDRRAAVGAETATALIRTRLLENPHRVDLAVRPDPEASRRRDAAERLRLEAEASRLGEEGLRELAERAERLRAEQERPDPPEAIATLPRLRRRDLDRPDAEPAVASDRVGGAERWRIEEPTRGIVYLDLGFDLRALPARLLPLVPVFGRLLLESGTETSELDELTRAIDRATGGIDTRTELAGGVDGRSGLARFFVRGRALAPRAGTLADLLAEVLTSARLTDRSRVRALLVETAARRRAMLEVAGTRFAVRRLAAHLGPEARAEEAMTGLASLAETTAWIERVDDAWEEVAEALTELRDRLVTRGALVAGVTADAAAHEAAGPALAELVDRLPAGHGARFDWTELPTPAPREGWTLPGQVHYVATQARLRDGAPLPGAWLAAARWLATEVMTPELRFRGGAYGGGTSLDPLVGTVRHTSYRDPNLRRTLEVMADAPRRLREEGAALPETEIETLVIGSVGALQPYELPAARGYRAVLRRLRGTEGMRDRLRDEALAAGPSAFVELADAIVAAGAPSVAALGPAASFAAMEGEERFEVRRPDAGPGVS